jgi:hypothetical protein
VIERNALFLLIPFIVNNYQNVRTEDVVGYLQLELEFVDF